MKVLIKSYVPDNQEAGSIVADTWIAVTATQETDYHNNKGLVKVLLLLYKSKAACNNGKNYIVRMKKEYNIDIATMKTIKWADDSVVTLFVQQNSGIGDVWDEQEIINGVPQTNPDGTPKMIPVDHNFFKDATIS